MRRPGQFMPFPLSWSTMDAAMNAVLRSLHKKSIFVDTNRFSGHAGMVHTYIHTYIQTFYSIIFCILTSDLGVLLKKTWSWQKISSQIIQFRNSGIFSFRRLILSLRASNMLCRLLKRAALALGISAGMPGWLPHGPQMKLCLIPHRRQCYSTPPPRSCEPRQHLAGIKSRVLRGGGGAARISRRRGGGAWRVAPGFQMRPKPAHFRPPLKLAGSQSICSASGAAAATNMAGLKVISRNVPALSWFISWSPLVAVKRSSDDSRGNMMRIYIDCYWAGNNNTLLLTMLTRAHFHENITAMKRNRDSWENFIWCLYEAL